MFGREKQHPVHEGRRFQRVRQITDDERGRDEMHRSRIISEIEALSGDEYLEVIVFWLRQANLLVLY